MKRSHFGLKIDVKPSQFNSEPSVGFGTARREPLSSRATTSTNWLSEQVSLIFLDRLGGAKADRRKEAAISTAVETYLRNHQSERADGRMSRGKMVLFFKFCFPLFLEIVLKVIRQETTKGKIPSFKNDSVFSNSSKIPYIETTDH